MTDQPALATFEYSEHEDGRRDDEFVIHVHAGIETKRDLMATIANAGNFPDQFGENWDALSDCLRDFSWISQRKIAIVHCDLPLKTDSLECRNYLEVLTDAVWDWRESNQNPSQSGTWEYPEHELRVVFPTSQKSALISTLL